MGVVSELVEASLSCLFVGVAGCPTLVVVLLLRALGNALKLELPVLEVVVGWWEILSCFPRSRWLQVPSGLE